MQPEPSILELYQFVVEKAPQEHPGRRARIYRALAPVVGNARDASQLIALAEQCEQLDANCTQLRLSFEQARGK